MNQSIRQSLLDRRTSWSSILSAHALTANTASMASLLHFTCKCMKSKIKNQKIKNPNRNQRGHQNGWRQWFLHQILLKPVWVSNICRTVYDSGLCMGWEWALCDMCLCKWLPHITLRVKSFFCFGAIAITSQENTILCPWSDFMYDKRDIIWVRNLQRRRAKTVSRCQ